MGAAKAGHMDPSARIAPPVKSKKRLANSGSIMPKIHPPIWEGKVGTLHKGRRTMEASAARRKPAAQAPVGKTLEGGFGKLVASQAPAVRRKTSRPPAAQVKHVGTP